MKCPNMMTALAAVLLALPVPAFADEPEPVASAAVQQAFADFLTRFRAALKANDAAAVADMTRMPFMPYMEDGGSGDAAAFRAETYPRLFPAKTRRCLTRAQAVYDREPDGGDAFVIFCGNLGFYFHRTTEGFLFTEVGPND